jgi:hypothetical protein
VTPLSRDAKIYVGYAITGGTDLAGGHYGASYLPLYNLLPVPAVLGNYSSNVRIWSVGKVSGKGRGNTVVSLAKGVPLPPVCEPIAPA